MERGVSLLPKGTNVSRLIRALTLSRGQWLDAATISDGWLDTPSVSLTCRAAINVMGTDNSAAISAYGIGQELIELLRGVSILGRLSPLMRPTPFRTNVPRETAGTSSAWVGEGNRKPVGRMTLDTVTLPNYKTSTIVVISGELAKLSSPSAERTVRTSLTKGVASFLDAQFLDPTITATSAHPASITNGAETQTSSGSTAADILADLQAMVAKLESWNEPRWIMKPSTAAFIAGSDATLFAQLRATPDGGILLGIPVLNSTNVPDTITLLDAGDILLADDGGVNISLSNEADIVLDDGGSPSQTEFVSLYQKNMIGVRVERAIAYVRGHDEAVVSMVVSY